nr:Crp/Fnr family transcriptional regulator [Hyphomonas sp. Mor2]
MNASEIATRLKQARLFRVLPRRELELLAKGSAMLTFGADSIVIYRGDTAEHVYLILEGSVAVESMSSHGRSLSISSLNAGEVFGEMAVLDGRDRSANIRTLEPTSLLLISKARFLSLLKESSEFSYEVVLDLVQRLRQADDQIEAIMFLPLKRRLADLLINMFKAQGPELKVTQADLANRLTATREKVNVNLQVLQEQGAIKLGRGRITLLDEHALAHIK